jgi:hypothetical protein
MVGIAFVSAEDDVKVKTMVVTGKLVSVDPDKTAITFVDTRTGENVTYVYNDTTTFYKDGSVIEVRTLMPEEMVKIMYDPDKKVIVRLDTPFVEVEEED